LGDGRRNRTVFIRGCGESTRCTYCHPALQHQERRDAASFDSIDVIEGPPELSLKFEPGKVNTFTTLRICSEAVPGGKVMVTASDMAERKEAMLVFRVSYKTKTGP